MSTTMKRKSVALTKEDMRMLKELCELKGENESQVIKRAIAFMYLTNFSKIYSCNQK